LMHPSSAGILQIWCRFSSFAIPWDPDVSFFYLRRLLQQHLSTAMCAAPASSQVPTSTDALRGQSTRVYAPLTPLRPSADEIVYSGTGVSASSSCG
jgi:hypothetical protein